MAVKRISRAFKDISLSFEMHPVTKDMPILKNESAIKRSIRNIVQTIPSERFFQPYFGSEIKNSLFEFVDFGSASLLEKQIEVAIKNFEPRVENPQIKVIPRANDNAFEIDIHYRIIGQDVPPQQFTYILEATR